jgi:hypothetical protein
MGNGNKSIIFTYWNKIFHDQRRMRGPLNIKISNTGPGSAFSAQNLIKITDWQNIYDRLWLKDLVLQYCTNETIRIGYMTEKKPSNNSIIVNLENYDNWYCIICIRDEFMIGKKALLYGV